MKDIDDTISLHVYIKKLLFKAVVCDIFGKFAMLFANVNCNYGFEKNVIAELCW